jgi:hypothetical protein
MPYSGKDAFAQRDGQERGRCQEVRCRDCKGPDRVHWNGGSLNNEAVLGGSKPPRPRSARSSTAPRACHESRLPASVRYSPRQRPAVMISMLRLANRAAALARRSSQVINGHQRLAQKPVALVKRGARLSGSLCNVFLS